MTKVLRYNLATLLAMSCCGFVGSSVAKGTEPTIGKIKWAISETATSRLLSSGEKELQTSDVVITRRLMLDKKTIELSDNFNFGLAESCNRHDAGFGLTGGRTDEKTFSWDWFNVDRPGHAKKLQESGELSFDTKKTPNGTEMNRMEFLTDISIRVSRRTDVNPLNPAWRIKIFKGSVICWPSLVNGKVVR
ncbi:MAG: hypothetical protein K2X93_01110 [Candidatus Obscuribacterales bacterium]|nr:hypothetical protein [Candidatus Obscuribacterales bacterium]